MDLHFSIPPRPPQGDSGGTGVTRSCGGSDFPVAVGVIRKAINLVNAEKGRGAEPHGITGEEKGLKRRKVEEDVVGVLGKMDMEAEEEEEDGSPLFHSPPSPPCEDPPGG